MIQKPESNGKCEFPLFVWLQFQLDGKWRNGYGCEKERSGNDLDKVQKAQIRLLGLIQAWIRLDSKLDPSLDSQCSNYRLLGLAIRPICSCSKDFRLLGLSQSPVLANHQSKKRPFWYRDFGASFDNPIFWLFLILLLTELSTAVHTLREDLIIRKERHRCTESSRRRQTSEGTASGRWWCHDRITVALFPAHLFSETSCFSETFQWAARFRWCGEEAIKRIGKAVEEEAKL